MKLFIASDIHGSAYWCRKMLEAFKNENADRLLILGDVLYHGPRNDLPRDYCPKDVFTMLNEIKDKIIAVRGNCDSEVDQMVLEFPMMADYAVLPVDTGIIYVTHGHLAGPDNPPPLSEGDYLLCGHFHVPANIKKGKFTYVNPGSVSLPKENSDHSYMIFENGKFTLKTLK